MAEGLRIIPCFTVRRDRPDRFTVAGRVSHSTPMRTRRARQSPLPAGDRLYPLHSWDYGRRTARSSRYWSITPSGLMLSTR
jgi:hypothetical protein